MMKIKDVVKSEALAKYFYSIVAALSLIFGLCVYLFIVRKDGAIVAPDSPGYIVFHPTRPIGYPVFIWVIQHLTGGYDAIPFIQTMLVYGALGWLAIALYKTVGRPIACLTALISLFVLFLDFKLFADLTTEATTVAALTLWAAQTLFFLRAPTLRGFAWACAAAAVAVLIRPGNIVVFPVMAALWASTYFRGDRRHSLGLAIILAISLTAALESTTLVHLALYHSPKSGSPLSRDLMGKVMFAKGGDEGGPADCDTPVIETALEPAREYVNRAPNYARSYIEQTYGDYLKYNYLLPAVAKAHGYRSEWMGDPTFMCQAKYRLSKHLGYYLNSVFREYINFVIAAPRIPFARLKDYSRFLAENPPPKTPSIEHAETDLELARRSARLWGGHSQNGPASAEASMRYDLKGPAAVYTVLAVVCFVFNFFPIVGLAIAWRRYGHAVLRNEIWIAAAALFATAHALLLLTAALEYGLVRYAQPIWPLSIAACLLALVAATAGPKTEASQLA